MTPTLSNGGVWIARISAGHVEALPVAPRVVEDVRQQDVLAAVERIGVDAEQRRAGRRRPWLTRSRSASASSRSSAGGAANERSTVSGRPALGAGRVDRDIDGVAEALDALAASGPTRPGPSSSRRRSARRTRSSVSPLRCASAGSIHGLEILRLRAAGNVEQQVAEVALGIDADRRDAVDRRLLRAGPGTGPSCRCRSCRRRRRASSGPSSRTAAGRRRCAAPPRSYSRPR